MVEQRLRGWAPAKAWGRLGWRKQREVLNLAKEGKLDRDPDVAKVSQVWAQWILSPHAIFFTFGWVGLLVLTIVGLVLVWQIDITPLEVVLGALIIISMTLLQQRRKGRLIQNAGRRTYQ
ncbi:MAG: hypothetical protein M3198_19535 [Actinomycetota bacterium]|nr:hypothetical protein [Actinomycetota bacterium]